MWRHAPLEILNRSYDKKMVRYVKVTSDKVKLSTISKEGEGLVNVLLEPALPNLIVSKGDLLMVHWQREVKDGGGHAYQLTGANWIDSPGIVAGEHSQQPLYIEEVDIETILK